VNIRLYIAGLNTLRQFALPVLAAACAVAIFTAESIAQTAQTPPAWTTQDVIDPRIDVSAQYGLMRMFTEDPVAAAAASAMLSAVKTGQLAGIYQPDQQVPALRAQSLGKGWWQLLPGGAVAVCITGPEGKPPLIVFSKEAKSQSYLLDPALRSAWSACGIEWAEPRPYLATLPPKQPATTAPAGQPTQLLVLVLDPAHNPVPGATVSIGAGVPVAGGVTNSAGLFTENAGPGVYHVEVDAPARLGGNRYYISAQVEEGRRLVNQVIVGSNVKNSPIQHSADSGPGAHVVGGDENVHGDTMSVSPHCMDNAADCVVGCTREALALGENCNSDPQCIYLESSRYDGCVKRCGISALVCPP
jgi:hypothetical protein